MSISTESISNIEYEKFVIGAMLLKDGVIIPDISAILTAEDFYRPEHRIVFNDILKIYAQNQPVSLLTLVEFMSNNGDLNKVDLEYVFMFAEIAHTTAHAEHYAKIIKEKSELRKLTHIAEKIIATATEGMTSPLDIIHNTSNEFSKFHNPDISKISSITEYLTQNFYNDIESQKKYTNRKTGFSNIDANQIFSAGLYVLGATPACGKTTFAWQLAEQLTLNGENCIFCSYEMAKLELFSKTIARNLFTRNKYDTLTAAEIRRGSWNSDIDEIIHEIKEANVNLRVIELHDETVDDLLKLLKPLCTNVDKAPVVFIDYLQIIPSKEKDSKRAIDNTVRKLKIFQRETNTTFIVISSFNRTNYLSSVSFESFKESGNIEYTADVIWALQLFIMNSFKTGTSVNSIRKKIDEAKKQQPRQIQLKCLKNRQGNNYDCFFNYFSAHDFFEVHEEEFKIEEESEPETEKTPEPENNSDSDKKIGNE
jgi:replicative DNA helicase